MKKVVPVLVLAFAVSCAFVSCKPKEQKKLEPVAKIDGDTLKTTEDALDTTENVLDTTEDAPDVRGKYAVTEINYVVGPNVSWSAYSGAKYCGNRKTISGYDVHLNRWNSAVANKKQNIEIFTGQKMTKAQQGAVTDALKQFDVEVGDIYSVGLCTEDSNYHRFYSITVEITAVNSKDSYTYNWWGFSYDSKKLGGHGAEFE